MARLLTNTDFEKYEFLISKIVHSYMRSSSIYNLDFNQLMHYGRIGLLKASLKFKSGKGTKFVTYAYKFILGSVVDNQYLEAGINRSSMRTSKSKGEKFKYLSYLGDPRPELGENKTLEDTIFSNEDILGDVIERERAENLMSVIKSLPDLEYNIIVLRFYQEANLNEIAEFFDRTEGWASLKVRSVVESLRSKVENMECRV